MSWLPRTNFRVRALPCYLFLPCFSKSMVDIWILVCTVIPSLSVVLIECSLVDPLVIAQEVPWSHARSSYSSFCESFLARPWSGAVPLVEGLRMALEPMLLPKRDPKGRSLTIGLSKGRQTQTAPIQVSIKLQKSASSKGQSRVTVSGSMAINVWRRMIDAIITLSGNIYQQLVLRSLSWINKSNLQAT